MIKHRYSVSRLCFARKTFTFLTVLFLSLSLTGGLNAQATDSQYRIPIQLNDGWEVIALNVLASITKSVTSTLIGICIDKGFIKNVDESVLALIPRYTKGMPNDPKKRAIKLRHIITMASGLEWLEHGTSYNDTQNSEWQMVDSEDWMAYVLSKPMQDNPGERYVYNTGAMHLLSAVIQNVSGLRTNGWGSSP